MGFFDKIKAAANSLTGGGAKVTMTVEATDIKSTIKINVSAEVKDAPINISQVYLWVKSEERINIPRNEIQSASVNEDKADHGVNLSKEIFLKKEFQISGPETLEANKTYNWSYNLDLSRENANPSYHGRFAYHNWYFLAGLDARGNDPDSGWIETTIN